MIEVRNLCRTYKTKKGVSVKALDNVSLKLPEKGMVFILGKSGSGKSTFLNVIGGLDKYDSGEIIIKGKSSKDFSQSDFDSYRNTYLGFIFQEYNILKQFTVGANIALAIELQNRKPTREEINKILEEVDLVGYQNRKPNELSGGQMQRVAIARALVKNPEIIMADEPTGALDSNTGKAVFDTLKKLSKEKLVVIVSHDREFAEDYADRIVEFKDGKIISDVEQSIVETSDSIKGVQIIDNKLIQIKKGYHVTEKDMEEIVSYINKANGTVVSLDGQLNNNIRKEAKINADGSTTTFVETDETKIDHRDQNFKLIKSRLPIRKAFKIGASSLKAKPVRLAFTIILSFIAFGLFGLANAMGSYDRIEASTSSIIDSNINYASFSKNEYEDGYEMYNTLLLDDDDLEELKADTGITYTGIYEYNNSITKNLACEQMVMDLAYYNTLSVFSGIMESSAADINKLGFQIVGTYPTEKDEIAITKAMAEVFVKAGYSEETTDKDNPSPDRYVSNVTDYRSMIDKTITLDGVKFTIKGIIDTKIDDSRYEDLKVKADNDSKIMSYILVSELGEITRYGYHTLLFIAPGTYQPGSSLGVDGVIFSNNKPILKMGNAGSIEIDGVVKSTSSDVIYFNSLKTDLSSNEMLINFTTFANIFGEQLIDDYCSSKLRSAWNEKRDYYTAYAEKEIEEAKSNGFSPTIDYYVEPEYLHEAEIDKYVEYLFNEGYYSNQYGEHNGYYLRNEWMYSLLLTMVSEGATNNLTYAPTYNRYNEKTFENITKNVNIVGVYKDDFDNQTSRIAIVTNDFFGSDTETEGKYAYAIAEMPSEKADINKISKFYNNSMKEAKTKDGNYYTLHNAPQYLLNQVNDTIDMLSKVFLWVGLGFAIFASILLLNFIMVSISYKRREIGILRAVGARGKDVFRIFFSESLLISLINFVFASIACTVAVIFINKALREEYDLLITIINMGILQYVLILGISVLVAFISSFLPVFKIARQRPIDAIREK